MPSTERALLAGLLISGPLGFLKFGDVSKCIYFLVAFQPNQPGGGWQAPAVVVMEEKVVPTGTRSGGRRAGETT